MPAPLQAAEVDFSDASAPQAPAYGDVYHARAGALAQAQHVFLAGNRLPQRWQSRPRFVVLETGFGLGNNFLATWDAWRADPQRCERLVFISVEKHPLRLQDLQRAHAHSPLPDLAQQLQALWPALTPDLHLLDFEGGRVQLMLALGEAQHWLAQLQAQVDAIYLDGFAPARNPDLWSPTVFKQLARLAAPDATAATWSVARSVLDGLQTAGFDAQKVPGFASKGQMCMAQLHAARRASPPPGRQALAPQARHVLVLGAGLAGAACARALARQGLSVTVLDARSAPAQVASGNPGGLYHGSLHADDGPHARFNRACALRTAQEVARIGSALSWHQAGMLRVERKPQALEAMQALLQRSALPPQYVQALAPEALNTMTGLPLSAPAWFYPTGGALCPGELARLWLQEAQAQLLMGVQVHSLEPLAHAQGWRVLDGAGRPLAQADALVLAAGTENARLAAPWVAGPALPWVSQRGQLSMATGTQLAGMPRPPLPLAGVGYALQGPDQALWFGATTQAHDPEPEPRPSDHAQNLQRLQQLMGHSLSDAELDAQTLAGRVGWRSLVADRLPLIGGLPCAVPAQRAEQARFWPRHAGLLLCGGLASRGITWATLAGELVAAQLLGLPMPLGADLLDAVDIARFAAREHR
ncbi:FAD-dependent 5-carboxymethylaminomethyl-2-thiouridine(34) oxidoreductase MnmC [Roseateles sp. BYS180W]|uniref:tRNA 5-methylaminomethyl-2-thiouridine biosynthesis bifunctional protein MnmC n=1 Tax=Roseateles rivi TaxID=3299028 RepID=A0ABW7FSV3_9BURK